MTGWHYTSKENWKKIKKQGLRPYKIYKTELKTWFRLPIEGIWIWMHPQEGIAHAGSIFYQVGTKKSSNIVLLQVEFDPEHRLRHEDYPGGDVILHHDVTINNYVYHDGSQTATIVIEKIKPRDIKLLAEYDLAKTLYEPRIEIR